MSLNFVVLNVDNILTKKEQTKVKGGNTDWDIITDLDVI